VTDFSNSPWNTASVVTIGTKYEWNGIEKRMRQKEDADLVVVIYKVEVGTRELIPDDLPEPVHWRTKRDVRGVS